MKQESKVASRRPISAKARTGVLLVVVAASATGGCGSFEDMLYRMSGGQYKSLDEEARAKGRQWQQDELVRQTILNSSMSEHSSEGTESPDPQSPPVDPQNPPVDPQNPPL